MWHHLISRHIVAMSSEAISNFDFSISRFCPVIIYDGMMRMPLYEISVLRNL